MTTDRAEPRAPDNEACFFPARNCQEICEAAPEIHLTGEIVRQERAMKPELEKKMSNRKHQESNAVHLKTSPHRIEAPRIAVIALGMSLGLFLALTFVLCVGFDLLFPALAMNPAWAPLLPGFTWLSWQSFLLGLVESFAYGWYVAVIVGPLYNFFAARSGGEAGL